jgi:hypothetical protein
MIRRHALLSSLLLLAACGDAPKDADKKAIATPAPLAPAPVSFLPGQWQSTSELVKMEVPGMPPEMAKANIGKKTSFAHCMTAEQAARPPADFFTNANQTTDCKAENFAIVGGKLDGTMTCVDKRTKTNMVMTIQGDYRPTSYAATMTMVTSGAPGGGDMKMTATTSGKRIGDCPAKAAGTQ